VGQLGLNADTVDRLASGQRRPWHPLAIGAVATTGAGTLLITALWQPHVQDPLLRGGIEMTAAVLLIFSAWLLGWSYFVTRTATAYFGFAAVVATALVDLFYSMLPTFVGPGNTTIAPAARVVSSLLLLLGFAVAVSAISRRRLVGQRRGRRLAARPIFIALGIGVVIDLLSGGTDPMTSRSGGTLVALVAGALLVTAALVLARSRRAADPGSAIRWDGPDGRSRLLGPTLVAVASAQLQVLLMPTTPASWVTPAEGMRLFACVLLLLLAVRVNRSTQRGILAAMLAAERLRIARDFHDGLAQDLCFISAHGERLAAELGGEHPLAVAARRALAVSRGVIVDLAASAEETTLDALRAVADEIESRYDVQIEVGPVDGKVGSSARLDGDERHEVVRIAREAMINAVRHGGARWVRVGLGTKDPGHVLLHVFDDGSGIDQSASTGGLGMRTMRQRARRLDARLSARRRRGGGTEIEVRT
jgi:signal transduction histidine kinase